MNEINRTSGAVSEKASTGTLTFAEPKTSIKEIGNVIKTYQSKNIMIKTETLNVLKH